MQVPLTLYLIKTLDVCHTVGAKQWVAFEFLFHFTVWLSWGSAACLCIDMFVFLLPLELVYKFTWTYSSEIWLDLWHISVDVNWKSGDEAGDSTRELLPTRAPCKAVWRPCIPPLGTLHIALKGKTCAFGNFLCWRAFQPLLLCSVALQGKELKKIPSVKEMWSVTAASTACVCVLRGMPVVSELWSWSASWLSMWFFTVPFWAPLLNGMCS